MEQDKPISQEFFNQRRNEGKKKADALTILLNQHNIPDDVIANGIVVFQSEEGSEVAFADISKLNRFFISQVQSPPTDIEELRYDPEYLFDRLISSHPDTYVLPSDNSQAIARIKAADKKMGLATWLDVRPESLEPNILNSFIQEAHEILSPEGIVLITTLLPEQEEQEVLSKTRDLLSQSSPHLEAKIFPIQPSLTGGVVLTSIGSYALLAKKSPHS